MTGRKRQDDWEAALSEALGEPLPEDDADEPGEGGVGGVFVVVVPPRDELGRLIIPGYDGPKLCTCDRVEGEQRNLFNDDTQCVVCGGLVSHLRTVE